MEAETRARVPAWLAVAITVCVSLPFAIWLGRFNLPIWASFIVWAEYFALGAKPAVLRTIVPAFFLGVVSATIIMTGYVALSKALGAGAIASVGEWTFTIDNLALFIACFLGFCIFTYGMKFFPVTQSGSLPYYNGISVMFAVYFTGAYASVVSSELDGLLLPTVAAVGALLAGLLGAFLGWFNVTIMFVRPTKPHRAGQRQPVAV